MKRRVLIIAPGFLGLGKRLAEALAPCFEVAIFEFDEEDYKRPRSTILKLFARLLPDRQYQSFVWDGDSFLSMLACRSDYENFDVFLFVKPFLLGLSNLNDKYADFQKMLGARGISFSYDTESRFPVRELRPYFAWMMAFDASDCLRYGFDYCPMPYDSPESIRRASRASGIAVQDPSRRVHFVGAFSVFRLVRLFIVSRTFCKAKITHCLVLVHKDFPFRLIRVPLTKIFFSRKARKLCNGNRLVLDVPQSQQSNGSDRSTSNGCMITYDIGVPVWRHIDTRTILSTFHSSRRVASLIASGIFFDLWSEEREGKRQVFLRKMASVINNVRIDL